jgi:hypothetical protein
MFVVSSRIPCFHQVKLTRGTFASNFGVRECLKQSELERQVLVYGWSSISSLSDTSQYYKPTRKVTPKLV